MPTADELLSASCVIQLSKCLRTAAPARTWSSVRASAKDFVDLGLGERAVLAREALLADLPASYAPSAEIIREMLKDEAFTSWMIWPVGEAVAMQAIPSPKESDFEDGLKLLSQLTGRFSSEFALRSFLNADLGRSLNAAVAWTSSSDEAVRRLASEGTRPRLPWAKQVPAISAHPGVTIKILDLLYSDESETVRRSVANHLNDISRADPDLAVKTAKRWLKNPQSTTARTVRHAMRTLVKQAHPGALALMGFSSPEGISISAPSVLVTTVPLGGELVFDGVIVNEGSREARLVIDYVVHYQKSNGTLAPKVFKLSTKTLLPGESITVRKRHSFKAISTRRHYVGPHSIELQVNGSRSGAAAFEVVD